MGWTQLLPTASHACANRDVLASLANIVEGTRGAVNEHSGRSRFAARLSLIGLLEAHDGIGSRGQRCTGHDPNRLAGGKRRHVTLAGSDMSGNGELYWRGPCRRDRIDCPHRIAIHCRVAEWRHVV